MKTPGFSGKNLERPGVQALIEAIKRREVDVVITYKIDRVARSVGDFFDFWQLLEDHDANFVSATESFDTGTPAGRLMLNMLLGFGQYERELTAERISDKLAERATGRTRQARQMGGRNHPARLRLRPANQKAQSSPGGGYASQTHLHAIRRAWQRHAGCAADHERRRPHTPARLSVPRR